jgi:hypothetical protein
MLSYDASMDDEFEDDADSEDEREDESEDEDMTDDYESDPGPKSKAQIARDAEAYKKYEKRNKRKELWGSILGASVIIVSILLGIGEIVAPLMIAAFVLYMIFHG